MIHGLRSTLQEMRGNNSSVVIDCEKENLEVWT